ncbi:unnamed protein product [Hermetia illucens]|uniref:SCP domain-containing protein n=1 Tax=Hermetia illucens TaxID=343691 RepID=A0A7R8UVF3_HERIL|nr:antigen 5 like allergen Cul n 1-like [Hermetia illucens]CAD7087250.1 unnamed protein product [Hermetia illucens]
MDKLQIVLILAFFLTYCNTQIRYCAPELCPSGVHIACQNQNRLFSPDCKAPRHLVNITRFKNLIVYNHNLYRHRVASGSMKRFRPAERMTTMLWDDELAYLAALNSITCKMEHDECRNTWRFKYSGQNLARRYSKPNIYTPRDIIVASIDGWFNEYKITTMADIRNYQSSSRMIGHFTVMMNDKNNRVGCALTKHSPHGGAEYYFACNYASTNVINKPVYKEGRAASKCTTGTNHLFSGLCRSYEPIDVNRWF